MKNTSRSLCPLLPFSVWVISRSGRLTDLLGPSIDEGDQPGIDGPGEGSGEAAGAEL